MNSFYTSTDNFVLLPAILLSLFALATLFCRGRGGLRPLCLAWHRYGLLAEFVARAFSAAAAEQNHVIGHHFGGINLLTVLVVVAPRLQAAFDVNLLAFRQILTDIFLPPENHIRPVRLFLPFSCLLILPAPAGCDGEAGNFLSSYVCPVAQSGSPASVSRHGLTDVLEAGRDTDGGQPSQSWS